MDKIDFKEKVWGLIFGIIAVVSAIAEMISGGVDVSSFFGMLKDISSTAVVIVVGFAFINSLPKKSPDTFEDEMTQALNQWIAAHSNMIVKTSKMPKGHENDFGMSMTTDISRFYNTERLESDAGNSVGRFLRMTRIDEKIYSDNAVQLEFFINAQTYCSADSSVEDAIAELLEIGRNLSSYIVGVVDGVEHGEPKKTDARTVVIPLSFKNPVVSDMGNNIDLVINVIDRMYEAMLVSARRK